VQRKHLLPNEILQIYALNSKVLHISELILLYCMQTICKLQGALNRNLEFSTHHSLILLRDFIQGAQTLTIMCTISTLHDLLLVLTDRVTAHSLCYFIFLGLVVVSSIFNFFTCKLALLDLANTSFLRMEFRLKRE
jgi:hypothetical protein